MPYATTIETSIEKIKNNPKLIQNFVDASIEGWYSYIYGNPELKLDGKYHVKNFLKDHRVFMMSTIAALTLGGNWKIFDPKSAETSFPSFLNLIKKVGGKYKYN